MYDQQLRTCVRRAEGLFKSRNALGCQVVKGTQGLSKVERGGAGTLGRREVWYCQ
jgi:hypothetical protein